MSGPPRDFPGQAFLELLRPPKLARTRLALFAAYSADPIVLGGALLNLCARGREDGGGNKSDFATAVETLRDRVRFLVQRGRIHRSRSLPKVAAVLDQFLVEIPFRERQNSWHPKLALVSYERPDGGHAWRLWIGSRNLTLSRDLDLGLVLDGDFRRRKGSRSIEGIDALGADLVSRAALAGFDPDAIARELRSVRWIAPDGIDVTKVELWTPGMSPAGPFVAGERRKLVVISPFLSDAFVATLTETTTQSADRTLVTTLPAVRALSAESKAALEKFSLFSLSAPDPEGAATWDEPTIVPSEAIDGSADESISGSGHSGLHAKLYAAIAGDTVEVVMGSANSTDRAWAGRNAEAVARFEGGQPEIDGIAAIVGSAFPIKDVHMAASEESESEIAERRLKPVRQRLAETPAVLRREKSRFTLVADFSPLLPDDMHLEVGLATMQLVAWPSAAAAVELGDVPLSLQTDLVQFRLSLCERPAASWLQRVPVSPPIAADRDAAAISRLLSVAGLQSWLREMLEGDGNTDTEDNWDAVEGVQSTGRHGSWKRDGFALEDVLAAWARKDHAKLSQVDRMLERYVSAVLMHSEHLSDHDREDLAELRETWAAVREILLERR